MKNILFFFLLIILSACAGNIEVHKAIPSELITDSEKGGYSRIDIRPGETEAPNHFLNTLSKNLRQNLTEFSLYRQNGGSLKVSIKIIGYNINRGASREIMGSLAGADEIISRVQVINIDTDQVIGESTVFTSSSMAYGESAMAWVHADDIATFLSSPK